MLTVNFLWGPAEVLQVFLYGGHYNSDIARTVSNGVVHVLSLPSFDWQAQAAPPDFGRYMMSCNVVGNRRMIVIGGNTIFSDTPSEIFDLLGSVLDPWPQGIGIFDLSDMEWKSSYDADAAAYVTPQVVKSFVQQNGRYPNSWTNDVVEKWFTQPGTEISLLSRRMMVDADNVAQVQATAARPAQDLQVPRPAGTTINTSRRIQGLSRAALSADSQS